MTTWNSCSIKRHISEILIILFVSMILLNLSCKKEPEPDPVLNDYLVSYEKVNNYSASFIKILLNTMNTVYPGIDSLIEDVAYGIDLYVIKYNTEYKGNPIVASGLVTIPVAQESFPILSFQNGTNTFKLNAPTVNPSEPMYTLLEMMASHGYIVVMADYLGFGETNSMLHPYYDKTSTNKVVMDLILATQELIKDKDIKAEFNNKHFLMGYSQGGWATLAALKEAEANYKGKIDVVAASCGAGAYDLTAMSDYVLAQEIYPGPLYLPYFIYSRITSGEIAQPLTKFFKEPFAARIPELFNGNYTNSEVDEQLTDTISYLITDELRLNLDTAPDFASLRAAMVTNSVPAWDPAALIRFVHGTSDLNVPPVQSEIIYNQFVSLGVDISRVSLIPMPGASHSSGLMPWGISSVLWFDSLKD